MKQQKDAPWIGSALSTQIRRHTRRQGTPKGIDTPKVNSALYHLFPTPLYHSLGLASRWSQQESSATMPPLRIPGIRPRMRHRRVTQDEVK